MKEKNKKEQALEIQQCVCLFTCFCCSSFVRFLIHILLFTTPHTFHFLASPFFFSLFFSLLLFFIQCPSPYPPHPHTKHAAIAKRKMNKKKSPPHTTMHTHTTVPPPLFSSASSTNVCSMHMPGCVGCLSALHVPAATRLQQHTPKNKTNKNTQ